MDQTHFPFLYSCTFLKPEFGVAGLNRRDMSDEREGEMVDGGEETCMI